MEVYTGAVGRSYRRLCSPQMGTEKSRHDTAKVTTPHLTSRNTNLKHRKFLISCSL